MIKPEIPSNENQRLKCLKSLNILDTASEERFDRVTRMARRLFDVPIALISIIDEDRQWFKSSLAVDHPQTSRDISFCAHTILEDGMLIIPDTTKDLRFFDNPMVTNEPHVRFYAGCQLSSSTGEKIGALCIADQKPRVFSSEDEQSLKDLALTIESEMASIEVSIMDELTNVLNRRGFLLLGEHSLNLCRRQEVDATLVFLDLNNFKPINDEFGHAQGDLILKEFSHQVSLSCRESDLFARMGGDEFVILFINADMERSEKILLKLQDKLNESSKDSSMNIDLSFSYGMFQTKYDKSYTIEYMMEKADSRMYQNKKTFKTKH